jgi:hypothetical protein
LAQKYSRLPHTHTTPDADATKSETLDGDDADLGYFDYIDVFESRMAEAIATLDVLASATTKIGEQI